MEKLIKKKPSVEVEYSAAVDMIRDTN